MKNETSQNDLRAINFKNFSLKTSKTIDKLNKKSSKSGLSKTEFCIFIPTFINIKEVDKHIEKIIAYRESKNKVHYLNKFAINFYDTKKLPDEKINKCR